MGEPRKRRKQADRQPVATHGNRFAAHGKEGVDGSSPSEGFAKFLLHFSTRSGAIEYRHHQFEPQGLRT
jgi:hypothetical protein